ERGPVEGPPAPTASGSLTGDGDGRSGASLDEELEREIAARKEALEEHVCPGCGTAHHPEDRFCRLCGAHLAATGRGESHA
ncbi:MAG: zinc ribbon domain-containing protein, partial [Actinobacteria bacterium]|nr:zinc ribbon domain-containing protein [Actinomycetota bacterium]